MGSAGNAGSQAAAMVIRGITVEGLDIRSFFKVFWKELQVGIICGVVMFIVNYLRGFLIFACARYLLPLATNCPFNFRLLSRYYYPYIYPP